MLCFCTSDTVLNILLNTLNKPLNQSSVNAIYNQYTLLFNLPMLLSSEDMGKH